MPVRRHSDPPTMAIIRGLRARSARIDPSSPTSEVFSLRSAHSMLSVPTSHSSGVLIDRISAMGAAAASPKVARHSGMPIMTMLPYTEPIAIDTASACGRRSRLVDSAIASTQVTATAPK